MSRPGNGIREGGVEIEARAKANSSAPPDGGPSALGGILTPTDRDRILQAMIECCGERGYAETTVGEVLSRAEVPHETFDALFSDKEDCALAAFNRVASEMLTTVSTIDRRNAGSPLASQVLGVRAILELMSARPGYASFSYIQARQGSTGRLHDAYESSARVLTVMIERLRDLAPGNTEPPPGATRAMLGGAEAVIRREIVAGRLDRLPALLPAFVYAVLVPFVGQEEALRQSRLVDSLPGEEG